MTRSWHNSVYLTLASILLTARTNSLGAEYVRETPRQIPVADNVDVVVVGGTTGAVAAAVAAARDGASVFLAAPYPYLGEDMTATLVRKGQSVDKTTEIFRLLHKHGICPMPMLMHHDEQPLISRAPKPYGLLNQIRRLRKAGAVSMQVLMLVPATGSKLYGETYTSGMAYESAGGRPVEEHMMGGNYVVASHHPKPWRKQLNILVAGIYFYNPARFLLALIRPKSRLYLADAVWQVLGMWGLGLTIRRTLGWAVRLRRGNIRRTTTPPTSHIPMRSACGAAADHALPGTPRAKRGELEHSAGTVSEEMRTARPVSTCARV